MDSRSSLKDIYCLALNLKSDILEKSGKTFVELGGDSFAALYVVNRLVDFYSKSEIAGDLYEGIFNKILTSNYRQFSEYLGQQTDSFNLFESDNDYENGNINNDSITSNGGIPENWSSQDYECFENNTPASNDPILNRQGSEERGFFHNDRSSDEHSISSAKNNGESAPHSRLKNKFYAITSQNKILFGGCMENEIPLHNKDSTTISNLTNFPIKDKHNPNNITLTIKSKQNLGKCIDASPLVVDSQLLDEPLVLIGCHSRRFVAMTIEGVLKWELVTSDRIESSATLTADGHFCVFGKNIPL